MLVNIPLTVRYGIHIYLRQTYRITAAQCCDGERSTSQGSSYLIYVQNI